MLHFSVWSVLSISETKEKRKKSLWYSCLCMMIFLSKKFGNGHANIRCIEDLHVKRQNHQEKLVGQVEKGLFEGLLGIKSARGVL